MEGFLFSTIRFLTVHNLNLIIFFPYIPDTKPMHMKKISPFLVFLFLLPVASQSQYRWDFGGGLGFSNYLGDIGGNQNTRRDFISDLKMAKTRFNISGFARMQFY